MILISKVRALLNTIHRLHHCTKMSSKLTNFYDMTLYQIARELRTFRRKVCAPFLNV